MRAAPVVRDVFQQHFGHPPAAVARAPGRVNLIGEHTDYNDGFVLPMALKQCTWVAAGPRSDGLVRVRSRDLDREQSWPQDGWEPTPSTTWTAYVAGVEALLRSAAGARLHGCDLLIQSDVPVGSGLSSSAALELATAHALAALAGVTLAPQALADLARRAEHEFAHVPCGIMDQYVSALGQADHALLLDCRTRTWQHIPLRLGSCCFVIVNSGVRHALAAGEYAQRQQQCHAAVDYYRATRPDVTALRDVDEATVRAPAPGLAPVAAARARHVVTENARTLAAVEALRAGHLSRFGELMYASHASLRDDYEVSCRELDLLVELVGAVGGVLGARMTGGGFGGCIVALAEQASVPQIEDVLRSKYNGAGLGPSHIILSRPGPGAGLASF